MSRVVLAWIGLGFVGALSAAQKAAPQNATEIGATPSLVLRDVQVVDVEHGELLPGRTLVITGGTIERIVASDGFQAPSGATVVEGGGRYLIPGLFDMHVHLSAADGEDALALYVANGVTTVQCMSGGPYALGLRASVQKGALFGPRIFTAGPTTAQLRVHTIADAERTVREQKAAGFDVLKQYGDGSDTMPRETYHALIAAAHAAGLQVVGHAPRNLPFSAVLEEHQDSIDHMEEIVYTDEGLARLLKPYVDLQFGRTSVADHPELVAQVPDFARELAPEIAALTKRVKAAGLYVTPTLITFGTIQATIDEAFFALLKKDELRFVPPARRAEWTPERARFRNGGWKPELAFFAAYLRRNHELQLALAKSFHDAGVPLMTGTDSPFDFVVQGFALHDELELFVRAGLSPLEALQCATLVPARFRGLAAESGTIAAGKRADLVLVEANPLADVTATRRVAGVVLNGRWHAGAELQQRIAEIARRNDALAPIVRDVSAALDAGELERAVEAFQAAKSTDSGLTGFVEQAINDFGFRLLNRNAFEPALTALRRNTELFPRSANAWDSLGEAYRKSGDAQAAVEAYERSLDLGNERARSTIEEILARGH